MTSLPASSMTCVKPFACCILVQEGRKEVHLDSSRALNICSSRGAGFGTVNEIATRREIGFELTQPEPGLSSNHFSTDSLEIGTKMSSSGSETEPNVKGVREIGMLEVLEQMSSNCSSPLGSH